jgi:hypothetical protein
MIVISATSQSSFSGPTDLRKNNWGCATSRVREVALHCGCRRAVHHRCSPPLTGVGRHRANLSMPPPLDHAWQPKTLLRRRRPAIRYLQLLSETTLSRHAAPSRHVSDRTGADARALPVRRRRLRDYARAHSPADQRTARMKRRITRSQCRRLSSDLRDAS